MYDSSLKWTSIHYLACMTLILSERPAVLDLTFHVKALFWTIQSHYKSILLQDCPMNISVGHILWNDSVTSSDWSFHKMRATSKNIHEQGAASLTNFHGGTCRRFYSDGWSCCERAWKEGQSHWGLNVIKIIISVSTLNVMCPELFNSAAFVKMGGET